MPWRLTDTRATLLIRDGKKGIDPLGCLVSDLFAFKEGSLCSCKPRNRDTGA
jgi:hypothetical protein